MKKRVISIIRNIFDGVMIFVLFITTTVYALPSNGVIYDNSNSGSSATNVSEAIDDLYSKLTTKDNEINRLKGLGNVASNQMLKGYTALVKGNLVTGTIPSKGATTYTPGTTNQTIASGNYLSGTQTIKGDANLVAGNIAKGKSIFGITGSYTSDANAVASDIKAGKTAYVNGVKIIGNASNSNITISSASEISYKTGGSSTTVSATYTATENNEYVVCISGHGGGVTTDGVILVNKVVAAGGAHKARLSIVKLSIGNNIKVSGWSSSYIYKLS